MRRNSERGAALFIEMLLVLTVLAILAAAIAPSAVKLVRDQNQQSVAQQLAQIGASELAFAQIYGGFPNLAALSVFDPSQPPSCANPMLANASEVQRPNGYAALSFTATGAASNPSSTCTTISLSAAYSITVTPNDPHARHFFMAQDGLVHFADGRAALSTDPVLPVATPSRTTLSLLLGTQPIGSGGNTANNANTFSGSTNQFPFVNGTIYSVPLITSGAQQPVAISGSVSSGSAMPSAGKVSGFTITITPAPNQGSAGGSFYAWMQDLNQVGSTVSVPPTYLPSNAYCHIQIPSGGAPVPPQTCTLNPGGQINSNDSVAVVIAPQSSLPDETVNWSLTYQQ